MQVRGEGGIGVGADVDGAIIVIILGKRDPLGSGGLLFQVSSDCFLLLPSEGDGMLACPCLVQGLGCGRSVVLLPLGGGGLFPVHVGEVGVFFRHGRQDGGG
jgi:hypothetical protein